MRAMAVDDEKLALESLRVKLMHVARISSVHAFSSPEAALDFFAENGADIAFLDISMAQMDGITLAKRLRRIKPNLLVIFVTGYADYAMDAMKLHADGYLMKPMDEEDIERELDALEQLRRKPETAKRIRVQCFGNFEVFVDGRPVTFARSKSKELLAYLVDRRGAKCAAAQIAAALWDDGRYDRKRQKQLSITRADMIKSLKAVGAENIIKNDRDGVSVMTEEFDCDYYRTLHGDKTARSAFTGEYMSTYSWAEFTVAALGEQMP